MVLSVRKVTPRRMVLDFRPVSVWTYRLFGLLFMAGGVAVAVLLAGAVSFRCSRFDGFCRYALSTPFDHQDRLFLVSELRGGTVEVRTNGLIASMTLVAMSRGGDLDIPLVAADGATKDSLARELTRYSTDPLTLEFEVHENRQLLGYEFGAFLFVAGLVCLLAIERVRLVLDRDKGLLQLKRRRWMWTRGVRAKLIKVRGVTSREHRFRRTASWSVTIHLEDGSELPLTRLPLFTAISAQQAKELVTRWLA